MLNFPVYTLINMANLLVAMAFGALCGYWAARLRDDKQRVEADRSRVETDTLKREIDKLSRTMTEERAQLALTLAENSLMLGDQKRIQAAHAAELESKDADRVAALLKKEEAHAAALASKESELIRLNDRIQDLEPLEARVCELTLTSAARQRELEACHAASNDLQRAHADLTRLKSEQDSKATEYAALISQLTDQLALNAAHNKELEDHLRKLSAEVESRIAALAEKDSQAGALKARATEIEAKLVELERLRDEFVEERAALTHALSAHESKAARFSGRTLELEGQVDWYQTRAAALEEALAHLKSEIESQVVLIAEKDTNLAALKAHLEAAETHAESLIATIADLRPVAAQVPELRSAQEFALTQLAGVTSQLKDLEIEHQAALAASEPLHTSNAKSGAAALPAIDREDDGDRIRTIEALYDEQIRAIENRYGAEISGLQQRLKEKESEPQNQVRIPTGRDIGETISKQAEEASPAMKAEIMELDESSSTETALPRLEGESDFIMFDPSRPRSSTILLSAKNAELRYLRETVKKLLGPVEPELVAPLAAQMKTGSDLENWLRAERAIRSERLERFREERNVSDLLF